jgi:uncharacterized protein YheU (UPF0270 family)
MESLILKVGVNYLWSAVTLDMKVVKMQRPAQTGEAYYSGRIFP